MNRAANQKGFTLIELMLAMGFVSALLLVIAMTVIQVGSLYSRGMMLKEVNQTARDMSNDFTRSINAQNTIDLANDYKQVTNGSTKVGGRLCLGSVSYVWNYGEALQKNDSALTKDWTGKPVRIAKVVDPTRKYCQVGGSGAVALTEIESVDSDKTSELLRESDRTLELYQLDVTSESSAYDAGTKQRLFTIQYTIGSGSYTALSDDRSSCKDPGEDGADIQYCTVEQFNVVIRARG